MCLVTKNLPHIKDQFWKLKNKRSPSLSQLGGATWMPVSRKAKKANVVVARIGLMLDPVQYVDKTSAG